MTEFEQGVLDRLDRIATLLATPAGTPGAAAWSCGLCHRWVPYAERHVCASLRTDGGTR